MLCCAATALACVLSKSQTAMTSERGSGGIAFEMLHPRPTEPDDCRADFRCLMSHRACSFRFWKNSSRYTGLSCVSHGGTGNQRFPMLQLLVVSESQYLFVTQCLCRGETGGFVCWIESEKYSDERGNPERNQRSFNRDDGRPTRLHKF